MLGLPGSAVRLSSIPEGKITVYSVRSYLTAGVAFAGAGALTIAPVTPMAQDVALAPRQVSALAVELAASQAAAVDPITLLVQTIETAANNAVALLTAYTANPFPIVQQVIANLITFAGELPDIGLILNQLVSSTISGLQAPFVANPENVSAVPFQTIELPPPFGPIPISQQFVYGLLDQVLPPETYAALEPILNFTTTPISGGLIGLLSPVIAPVLSLSTSVSIIIEALQAGDFAAVINEAINTPIYALNAFLNGGEFLDLQPVLSLLGITLPAEITSFGLNIGGLLSPGGVGFDSVSANGTFQILPAPLPPVTLEDPGFPLGPIGALITIDNAIAEGIAVTPPSSAGAEPAAAVEPSAEAEADTAAAADTDAAAETAPAADRSEGAAAAKREQRRGSRGAAADKAGAADSSGKSESRAAAARRAG